MTEFTQTAEIPKYKLIFLGDQGTGKSSILNRFVDDKFDPNYQATIGLDFQSKNVKIDNQDIHLLLYDTAGQEKFRSLIPMYTRDANIIILVYDITRKESFTHIPDWVKDLTNVKLDEVIFGLVGNKIDLEDQRQVTKEEGEKYAHLFYKKIFEQIIIKFRPGGQTAEQEVQDIGKIKIEEPMKKDGKKTGCCK